MIQNNSSPVFERFSEPEEYNEKYNECIECHEAIYNPLCPFCLAKEVQVWLASYPDKKIKDKILQNIRKYLMTIHKLSIKRGKATKCAVCGKRASLCPYCFTNYVYNLLKELDVNRIMLKEFLQFFNFDFEHTGYYKEAEKLGIY
jgi:hypothetical protein